MADAHLFSKTTQALFYNFKQFPIQQMLDFDYYCGRETPSVAGIICSIVGAACAAHPTADVFINFASRGRAAGSTMAALKQPTIKVVAIIAEGVPEEDTKELIAYARSNNKVIIGPATVGCIQAGAFKIGSTVGTIGDIINFKLYWPGSIGLVSKSCGMVNKMYSTITRATDGIFESIAIGGDVVPGSTLSDHVLRFNNIPEIKMIVVLGELGGRDEYSVVEALKLGKINKPVVAWVSGTTLFKTEVPFGGDAGEMESAQAKNQALKDAGAVVPTSFEAMEDAIKETFAMLTADGKISPVKEVACGGSQPGGSQHISEEPGKPGLLSTIYFDRGTDLLRRRLKQPLYMHPWEEDYYTSFLGGSRHRFLAFRDFLTKADTGFPTDSRGKNLF